MNSIEPLKLVTALRYNAPGNRYGAQLVGTFVEHKKRMDQFGVLIMAHGGPPEWNRSVAAAVEPLRDHYKVEIAFGMADAASIQEGVRRLEAQGVRKIGVVRLFVSGESWYGRTQQILGLAPGAPEPPSASGHAHSTGDHTHNHAMAFWRVETKASFALSAQGLGEAPETGSILAERARALSRTPEREDVLILAHGPGDDDENQRWIAHIDARAETVRQALPFRRVQIETLREGWPDKRKTAELRIRGFVQRAADEGGTAIVVPFRVQGFGPYARVLEGLDYVADRAGLLPHHTVTNWIEGQISALKRGPFRGPTDARPRAADASAAACAMTMRSRSQMVTAGVPAASSD